ncbi:MAG: ABC transporter ATP-binding protein [Clostridia bacterium]|nr:ABC transporter ATP-binding protein [Clostridia bacterium]
MTMHSSVELHSVWKEYPAQRRLRRDTAVRAPAVADLTLSVEAGEVVGLLGPNGAGKSTALGMMAGLITPTAGRILIGGADIVRRRRDAVARIGMVFDRGRTLYPRMTAYENIEYFAALRGAGGRRALSAASREWIRFFGMERWVAMPVNDLSMGMRQKVSIAASLCARPQVLLMDEPTLGLDVQSSVELRALIRRLAQDEGRSVIISTHQMDMAQDVCDRVCILSEGRVLALDRVSALLSLFAARAYRIDLTGELESAARDGLGRIGRVRISREDGRTVVWIDVASQARLFEAMDLLRAAQIGVESVGRVEPCLEKVFLELTGKPRYAR